MKEFLELKALVEDMEADATKFFTKGNQAAGTRLRVKLSRLRDGAKELRKIASVRPNVG